jgi:hypothetical protein
VAPSTAGNGVNGPGLFEQPLKGQGIVTASFTANPTTPGEPADFNFQRMRFDFTGTEAVPEPGTLLLLGTGLAATVRLRKRRAI